MRIKSVHRFIDGYSGEKLPAELCMHLFWDTCCSVRIKFEVYLWQKVVFPRKSLAIIVIRNEYVSTEQ